MSTPSKPGAAGSAEARRPAFAAYVADETLRDMVTDCAGQCGFADAVVEKGDIAVAAKKLAGVATPERLLVDLGERPDPSEALESLASVCDPGTRVVLLGTVNDVAFYRDLLSAGIEDYLVKPVSRDGLKDLLTRVGQTPGLAADGGRIGDMVVVVGSRGGVGASTTASCLSWVFAHDYKRRTALVDLDLHFGTCAVSLDLHPSGGLREALANAARIDETFVEGAMLKVSDSLWLLAPGDEMVEAQAFDVAALQRLIETLRKSFQMVVIDLPRYAARTQIGVFDPPFSVALVSDPSLSGLRDTVKLRTWFLKLVPDVTIQVGLNRVGAAKGAELSAKDFESSSGLKLACSIPLEARSAATAVMEAKPLVSTASRGPAARAFRQFAVALAGKPAQKAAPALWRRLTTAKR